MAKEFRAKTVIDLGEGFKVECEASGKKIIADEPLSFGGTDLGMNPIELLLSGLGACKCVTSKVIAKKNGLKLDYLAVECIGFFRPGTLGLSDIETIYHIKSDVSDEELEKFMALVDDSCPVHATIKNPAPIAHKLVRV